MVKTQDQVCGDWYSCPTPANPAKMCHDCTPEVWECQGHNVFEYSCVSTCDDTPPTNLSVSNITTNTATISWTPGTGGASQLIRVDEDLWEVQNGCPTPRDCEAAATLLTTASSEIVSGLLPLTTYYARIVTYSDSACYVDAITSFTTLNNAVIGNVYLDTNNDCARNTPMAGQTVMLDSLLGQTTMADGGFVFDAVDPNSAHTLAVTIPTGYVCSTGSGCANGCSKTGVLSPSSNNYFYLTQNKEAWWQVSGGGVYAGSTAGGDVIRFQLKNEAKRIGYNFPRRSCSHQHQLGGD
jgi:hypothetical protein